MNNYILITRPNYDFPTTYLYQWSELVIDEAKSKGITVLDLDGKKANKQNFASYISRNNPRLIFLNGHGSRDCVTGYNKDFWLIRSKERQTKPLSDPIAKLYAVMSKLKFKLE